MEPAASSTGEPPRSRRVWVYLILLLFVLPVLYATLTLRLMDLGV